MRYDLIKKFSDDYFNEIKGELSSISEKLDLLISSILEQQTEHISKKISELNNKFNQQSSSIQNILQQLTAKIQNFSQQKNNKSIEYKKDNEAKIQNNNKSSFTLDKLKVVEIIKNVHSNRINSLCILKDKRLVSGGGKEIIVYDDSHKPQIKIKNAHDDIICSLYVLRNGDLTSSSDDKMIKIWRIGKNDYQLIHTLKGHTSFVYKVIELEDGRLSSCSNDKAIKIWNNYTYQPIKTLIGHTDGIKSIIEMNDSIISGSFNKDCTLRKWNKTTYECIQIFENVQCCSKNSLEKLNNHTLLLGGNCVLFVVDVESSEVKQLKDNTLGLVSCFRVMRNDLVLFGDEKGEICSYNPISNQIISKSKFHNDRIRCLIETEKNQLISSSNDRTINVYEYAHQFLGYLEKV